LDKFSVSGKIPKTPEMTKNWSISESYPKIHKNHKYYEMTFGEIGF